jgi:hypothetical protein
MAENKPNYYKVLKTLRCGIFAHDNGGRNVFGWGISRDRL